MIQKYICDNNLNKLNDPRDSPICLPVFVPNIVKEMTVYKWHDLNVKSAKPNTECWKVVKVDNRNYLRVVPQPVKAGKVTIRHLFKVSVELKTKQIKISVMWT